MHVAPGFICRAVETDGTADLGRRRKGRFMGQGVWFLKTDLSNACGCTLCPFVWTAFVRCAEAPSAPAFVKASMVHDSPPHWMGMAGDRKDVSRGRLKARCSEMSSSTRRQAHSCGRGRDWDAASTFDLRRTRRGPFQRSWSGGGFSPSPGFRRPSAVGQV